jgi:hypothetical protein
MTDGLLLLSTVYAVIGLGLCFAFGRACTVMAVDHCCHVALAYMRHMPLMLTMSCEAERSGVDASAYSSGLT